MRNTMTDGLSFCEHEVAEVSRFIQKHMFEITTKNSQLKMCNN